MGVCLSLISMLLANFSIKKPVTVVMATAAVIIFGLISWRNLAINLLPNITFPTLTIRTEYTGSAPGEIENLISKPIEEAVGVASGVVRVSSVSRAGLSDVVVEFDWGTKMDFAAIDIREKLDGVSLPRDATKPVLLRFDPSLDPIMRISLYGSDDLVALRLIAEEQLKRRLESIEGVASILISGGLEEEIHVEVQEARLAHLDLSIAQIADRLSRENINLTGGTLKDGEAEFLVRTLNQFVTVEEINDIIVQEKGAAVIKLIDVGRAFKSSKQRSVITRTNTSESVEIAIFKEADTNTVAVAAAVKSRLNPILEELKSTFPAADIEIVSDQSRFISQSIAEVLKAAIWGGALAILVLYFFLKNIRSTIIVGLAIPISIIAAFFLMYVSKISLNIMSLGGLALGVGMLVDNAIVVLESISRHRSEGKPVQDAARLGASEVGKAVTAATLTTICVFVPIIFVQGVAGQLFVDQALTVTFSLLVSLAVALTVIPMLSSIRLNSAQNPANPVSSRAANVLALPLKAIKTVILWVMKAVKLLLTPAFKLFDLIFGLIAAAYPKTLGWALNHKALVLLIAALFFGLSLLAVPRLGSELIPEVSQGEFIVNVKTPPGTPIEGTDNVMATMAQLPHDEAAVNLIYSLAGASGGFSSSASADRTNVGQILIALDKGTSREEEQRIIENLRQEFSGIPGIEYKFGLPALFTFNAPIELEIKGYNLNKLKELSDTISKKMENIEGLRDIRSNIEDGNPEAQIIFNRQRLSALGLDVETIATIVRDKIQGEIATEYSSGERKIDVKVSVQDQDRKDLEDLRNLTIATRGDVFVPLSAIAKIRIQRGLGEILRMDQERVALVSSNLSGRDLGSAVADIEQAIADIAMSGDFSVTIGGQRQEMVLSFDSMRFAIFLAVFLVYMVMAAQFESLLHPLIIMVTIPFGLVGVILILLITGTAISVVVLIGAIMMTGIVVNNAIVLVDFINRLRKEGLEKTKAILEAGRIRLRPILMTTSTTVLGLLPMALGFGEGAEIRAPMALTIIGGLLVATSLTLILIPTAYAAFDRRKEAA